MSLQKLLTHLQEIVDNKPKTTVDDLMDNIKEYILEQNKQYKKNVQDGKISFGKYKGFSVKELSGLEKGLDYLGWLLKQQWFSEDKFGSLYDAIRNDTNLLPKKSSKKT